MRVLFVARATLYSVYGGDTVQMESTAKYLRRMGVEVDIKLSGDEIDYSRYDLLHIFNIVRPGDALVHINKSGLPYVVSTIFVDFSEYEAMGKGLRPVLSRTLSADRFEYLKALARWAKNGEAIQSREYLLKGHKKAIQQVARGAAYLLPNSENEYRRFVTKYQVTRPYKVVYNGIDMEAFRVRENGNIVRDENLVLCVARIEGRKNQLNLIKALNNTRFKLKLVGKAAPNHTAYFNECKRIAAANVTFEDFIPHEHKAEEYLRAQVHVLPSWNETCGLSSLEAAYQGCSLVITDKGDTREYFGDSAQYCDPADPRSIYDAIERAASLGADKALKEKIITDYNWMAAAEDTLSAYEATLNRKLPRLKTALYNAEL